MRHVVSALAPRPVLLGAAVLLLTLQVGCSRSIVGKWRLAEAIPNREVFSIDHANFRPDGTFSATTTIEGRTSEESGTYEFNGFRLTLRPDAGGQRAYPANARGGRLQVSKGSKKAILRRVSRDPE